MTGPEASLSPTRPGRPLRVAHWLVAGDIDGIGLHVLDLAQAQIQSRTVDPLLVTHPSAPYRALVDDAGVPTLTTGKVAFPWALTSYRRVDLVDRGIDLVHIHGYRATHLWPAITALAGSRWNLPALATCHSLAQGGLRRRARAKLELWSYASTGGVLTTSRELARRIERNHGQLRVWYVPNGVRLACPNRDPDSVRRTILQRFDLPGDGEIVAAIGRLAPEKRIDLFLDAAGTIAARYPKACFLILGEGRLLPKLRARMAALGLDGRTRFAGLVNDVAVICEALTLLIHSSDSEGTPRAVLHAMAAGVPVVATSVGGVPDLVRQGVDGLLTPARDARALADAALSLLDDPALRSKMGQSARARVESEFSIELMSQRVLECYRSTLNAAHGELVAEGS